MKIFFVFHLWRNVHLTPFKASSIYRSNFKFGIFFRPNWYPLTTPYLKSVWWIIRIRVGMTYLAECFIDMLFYWINVSIQWENYWCFLEHLNKDKIDKVFSLVFCIKACHVKTVLYRIIALFIFSMRST